MPELGPADVATFTGGRLAADHPAVPGLLAAALARARRYTRWPVSPVIPNAVFTVDGPGGRELYLRTKKIVSVASIVENGQTVDPSSYALSTGVPQMIYRKDRCWTCRPVGVTVTASHGFTEEEAADWRRAILQMVDLMSRWPQTGTRSDDDLKRKKVSIVEYEYFDYAAAADHAITSVESILDEYCLAPTGFA